MESKNYLSSEVYHDGEYLPEEESFEFPVEGPYIQVGWFTRDNDPDKRVYATDYGTRYKTQMERKGRRFFLTELSLIGLN